MKNLKSIFSLSNLLNWLSLGLLHHFVPRNDCNREISSLRLRNPVEAESNLKVTDYCKCFFLLTIFCLSLLFTGCGGGGGSGNGNILSPEELEVAGAIETFASAVRNEDIETSMSFVFSNLKYFTTSNPVGYNEFKNRLQNLFSKATVNDFTISDIGVSTDGEELASVIAQLTLVYDDAGTVATLSETIDLNLEKEGEQWGITLFGGHNTWLTTSFPPEL